MKSDRLDSLKKRERGKEGEKEKEGERDTHTQKTFCLTCVKHMQNLN